MEKKFKPGDTILSSYHVDSVIGEGGMGIVYKVMDGDRIVALKTIKQEFQKHVLSHPYFVGEAKVCFDISHNNVVEVFEISKSPCYIKMEYIEGGLNLKKWKEKQKPLPDRNTIMSIIQGICEGLAYLHSEMVVHRDIKPSNILMKKENDNYIPKIGDFGVSKKLNTDGKLVSNQVCGDDRFKAPEMTPGATIDHKVDIYAMAIIAYELLTGENYISEKKTLSDQLEDDVQEVFKRAFNSDPEKRPEADDFWNELDRIINKTILNDEKSRKKSPPAEYEKDADTKERQIKIPLDAIYPKDERYSFKINEGSDNPLKFYFVLDANHNPIKLGDGTFGVVFCIYESTSNELYAVKLFYRSNTSEEDPSDKDSEERFDFESKALSIINSKLLKLGQKLVAGLIINKGGTRKFTGSPAYETFKKYFKSLRMDVSNYAIVMDQYDFTLKELLEEGTGFFTIRLSYLDNKFTKIPHSLYEIAEKAKPGKKEIEKLIKNNADISVSQKEELMNNISECNGYDILKNMTFRKRIKTILPFLFSIAQGLRALHLAEMYHLDLKPGNIFVRKVGGVVDAVLGDLGFLAPQKLKVTSVATFHNILPLGTKHYRSPEQKDYFDICDIEIKYRHAHNNKDNVILVARDPKFKNSIIEKGDWLFFSKDSEHKRYIIHLIYEETDNIIIEIRNSDKDRTFVTDLKPDKSTQIIIYKNQQIRTDLFGFGAVLFDMFTGGQSAEQFYDNIRIYDLQDCDIKGLVNEYKKVSSNQSSDHSLIHAFKPFKHMRSSDYAPTEIVELILNCMLYKAQNTYFDLSLNNGDLPTEYLFKSVINIRNQYEQGDSIDNSLFDPNIQTALLSDRDNYIASKIEALNKYTPDNTREYARRLSEGVWYFRELVKMVQDALINDSKKRYLAQMLPDNIEIKNDRELVFANFVYQEEQNYITDLKDDRAYTSIPGDGRNPYIPDYITYMRREIRLVSKETDNQFQYSFFDALTSGDNVDINDWILINKELWRIKAVNDGIITIEQFNPQNKTDKKGNKTEKTEVIIYKPSVDEQKKRYIFYRNIEPCKYYLEMLGIYLYNIFFVGVGKDMSKKPIITAFYSQLAGLHQNWDIIRLIPDTIPEKSGKQYAMITSFDEKVYRNLDPESQLLTIQLSLVYLYFKLTFYQCDTSYYQKFSDNEQRVLAISKYVEKIQEMIEIFLNLGAGKLNLAIQHIQKEIVSKKDLENCDELFSKVNNFNDLFRNIVNVDLSKTTIGQKPILQSGSKKMFPGMLRRFKK